VVVRPDATRTRRGPGPLRRRRAGPRGLPSGTRWSPRLVAGT